MSEIPQPHSLGDLNQPARKWLAAACENFAVLLRDGEDPTLNITLHGVQMELRVMSIPGHFERVTLHVPASEIQPS